MAGSELTNIQRLLKRELLTREVCGPGAGAPSSGGGRGRTGRLSKNKKRFAFPSRSTVDGSEGGEAGSQAPAAPPPQGGGLSGSGVGGVYFFSKGGREGGGEERVKLSSQEEEESLIKELTTQAISLR